MTTNAVLATRALKRLRVIGSAEEPAAADQADAVQALVDLHASWTADGLTVPGLPLEERFDQSLVAILAVRLAGDYGKGLDEVLVRDAKRGERQIKAAFFGVPASRFDDAVKNTGHQYGEGIILGQTEENYSAWQAATAYRLREFVLNGANLYECIGEGTSAASGGPTGTNSFITDGTVTWVWRRIVGEPPQS
jgi:hypothetical protein